jgi:hypothetical protein
VKKKEGDAQWAIEDAFIIEHAYPIKRALARWQNSMRNRLIRAEQELGEMLVEKRVPFEGSIQDRVGRFLKIPVCKDPVDEAEVVLREEWPRINEDIEKGILKGLSFHLRKEEGDPLLKRIWERLKTRDSMQGQPSLIHLCKDAGLPALTWAVKNGISLDGKNEKGQTLFHACVIPKSLDNVTLAWLMFDVRARGYKKQRKIAIAKFIESLQSMLVYSFDTTKAWCEAIEKVQRNDLASEVKRSKLKIIKKEDGLRQRVKEISTFSVNAALWRRRLASIGTTDGSIKAIEDWLEDWQSKVPFSETEKHWLGDHYDKQDLKAREALFLSKQRFDNAALKKMVQAPTEPIERARRSVL